MNSTTSYIYHVFDQLVLDLNPQRKEITKQENEIYQKKIEEEKIEIEKKIKNSVYLLHDAKQKKDLIRNYHNDLVNLINQTVVNSNDAVKSSNTSKIYSQLLTAQHGLLDFLSRNYEKHLNGSQTAPITRLLELKLDLIRKRPLLLEKLIQGGNGEELQNVMKKIWDDLEERIDKMQPVYVSEVQYHEGVIRDILNSDQSNMKSECPTLHEMILYWNLNSKECLRYLSRGLDKILIALPDYEQKLEFLRKQQLLVDTLPKHSAAIYDPKYPSIKKYFTRYLDNEINYLLYKQAGVQTNEEVKKNKFKILCNIGVDELGLILRAATAKKIIDCPSVNQVCDSIVPFLSTKYKDELSAKSVRNKAWSAERRNEEAAISALQDIIEEIPRLNYR